MTEFSRITYGVDKGVARITLDRVDVRNAQDKAMLYELNDAFDLASRDDAVKVIVLAANGPHFSSGHDLADRTDVTEFPQVSNWGGYDKPGAEGRQALEGNLFGTVLALAQFAQTDHSRGPGQGYRRWPDVGVGLRSYCGDRGRDFFRSRGGFRCQRCGVFCSPVGVRATESKRATVYRRSHDCTRSVVLRHGQSCRGTC